MIQPRPPVDDADPPLLLRLAAQVDILEIADHVALVEAADIARQLHRHQQAGAGYRLDLPHVVIVARIASLARMQAEAPAGELGKRLVGAALVLDRLVLEDEHRPHHADLRSCRSRLDHAVEPVRRLREHVGVEEADIRAARQPQSHIVGRRVADIGRQRDQPERQAEPGETGGGQRLGGAQQRRIVEHVDDLVVPAQRAREEGQLQLHEVDAAIKRHDDRAARRRRHVAKDHLLEADAVHQPEPVHRRHRRTQHMVVALRQLVVAQLQVAQRLLDGVDAGAADLRDPLEGDVA